MRACPKPILHNVNSEPGANLPGKRERILGLGKSSGLEWMFTPYAMLFVQFGI